jgi:RNA polymerase sigma-32 factor
MRASPAAKTLPGTMLTPEDERALLRHWQAQRDGAAMRRLLDAYAPLVSKHVASFGKYGLPVEDMRQEGNLALITAADRFDLGRDVRFATYAVWWLRSALQEYVLRNWSIVRLGSTRERKSLFFKLRHVKARLGMEGAEDGVSRADALDRAANMLGAPRSEVERMEAVLRRGDHALNAPRGADGEEWGALLADSGPDPEALAIASDDRRRFAALVSGALGALSERERRIVEARRLGEAPPTLRDLGDRLGLSTERVRQIENAALEKMRRALMAEGAQPGMLLADPVCATAGIALA